MATRFLAALLASVAVGAHAVPIGFTSTQYDTTAFAVTGAVADADSDSSPTSALPLLSTATAVGANDFATSAAFGAPSLFFTSAEADSFPGAVGGSAGAQSHFVGSILGNGRLNLQLDFDSLDSIVGGGFGDGTLFVLLTNTVGATTTTLFNDFFSVSGLYSLQFAVPVGSVSTLDLLLFSEAATTGAGQSGQNFSQVTISGTIPVPPTPLLVVAGLAALLTSRLGPKLSKAVIRS